MCPLPAACIRVFFAYISLSSVAMVTMGFRQLYSFHPGALHARLATEHPTVTCNRTTWPISLVASFLRSHGDNAGAIEAALQLLGGDISMRARASAQFKVSMQQYTAPLCMQPRRQCRHFLFLLSYHGYRHAACPQPRVE